MQAGDLVAAARVRRESELNHEGPPKKVDLRPLSGRSGGVLGAWSSGKATGAPIEQHAAKPDAKSLTDGNTAFAIGLYRQLAGEEEGNLFFSPYSLSAALAMAYCGARGETAVQISNTLHFDLPQETVSAAFRELTRMLEVEREREDKTKGELAIGNRLWGQRGHEFRDSFLEMIRVNFGGGFETVDFQREAETVRLAINRWVEDQTRQKIKDLLQRGDVTPASRLVLVNAVYFKSDWLRQFDPEKTCDRPFVLDAKQSVKVPMMSMKERLRLFESDELQVLEMSYEGLVLSMVVFLPRKLEGLTALERSLTAPAIIQGWLKGLRYREVKLFLPKFRITTRLDLQETLAAMGMPIVFKREADFSGMDGRRDLFISKVVQQAHIEVDEEGTEAAAATALGVALDARQPQPAAFRADHPFIFLIRNRRTGSILFMGRVADPIAGGEE